MIEAKNTNLLRKLLFSETTLEYFFLHESKGGKLLTDDTPSDQSAICIGYYIAKHSVPEQRLVQHWMTRAICIQ